jgi:protocatechuate 3,4-dioxygenase beta subunit
MIPRVSVRVDGLLKIRGILNPLIAARSLGVGLLAAGICLGLWASNRSAMAEDLKPAATKSNADDGKVEKPAETGTGKITGQVKFEKDGAVAANAKVILLPPPPKGETVYIGLLPLREISADSEGKFSFDSLAPGRYRIWANQGRLTSRKKSKQGVVVILEDGAAPSPPVDLLLADGIAVTVRAVDKATGKLIPDATVHLGWSDLVGDFQSAGNEPVVVQPLTPERWNFEVWAAGYARESRWLNLENGKDTEAEFQLGPGGDLAGVIRDPAGKPVAGVGVGLNIDGESRQVAWTTTDASGAYKLNHIPIAIGLKLHISKLNWLSQDTPLLLANSKQDHDITLTPRPHGGTITGIVEDKQGQPIAGAVLINMGRSSSEIRETTSDAQGRFRLDNLYPGIAGTEVMVRSRTFAPKQMKVEPGPAEKPNEVTITLSEGHRIRGRVTDDDGNPLEGVTVYFANGNHAFSNGGKGMTNKEGLFEFDSLPTNCPFTFYKAGFSQINEQKLPLDKSDIVAIRMIPSGAIPGRVIDQVTGKPVRNMNVQIMFTPKPHPGDPQATISSDWIKPGQAFQSETGQFKLANLMTGMALQVMVESEGYERTVIERLVVVRGDKAEEIEFKMRPIDPATLRKYRGRLVDSNGAPVVGVQLRLFASRDRNPNQRSQFPFNWQMIESGQMSQHPNVLRYLSGTTDREGRFEFSGIPRDAEAELAWWGDNVVCGRVDHLEALDEKNLLAITLPAPARVTGTIDLKQFAKARQVEVSPHEQGLDRRLLVNLRPGQKEFEMGNLSPGKYTVSLISELERLPDGRGLTNKRLSSVTVEVQAGEVKEVDFE